MKVVIADDDPNIRLALKMVLHDLSDDVVECQNGAEAWEALQTSVLPGLAILDWDMPEMTGVEVCRHAKASEATRLIHILLLTGRTEEDHIVEALEAGADDFVSKPFKPRELAARVGVGLRIARLEAQVLRAAQDQVVVEMAGAAAHEINQPLTVLFGQAEILLAILPADDPNRKRAESIRAAGTEIETIVRKMKDAGGYASKHYVMGKNIIDLDGAARR